MIGVFAVIKTGGKQYKVAAGDKITIEKLEGEDGVGILFSDVLMIGNGEVITLGSPTIAGAGVTANIVSQTRGPKVISFKKRRRQNSKRKRGHRQDLTIVQIAEILASGAKAPAALLATTAVAAAVKAPAKSKARPTLGEGDVPDNLSLISGVGPVYEKKLHDYGITKFAQIAAWSAEEIAKWDEELSPKGRVTRDEWIAQANELIAGKAPRAKIDQAELASGKDK
jgi:large subunit ribosomal protein L21